MSCDRGTPAVFTRIAGFAPAWAAILRWAMCGLLFGISGVRAVAPHSTGAMEFDLPGDRADRVLKRFARIAGVEVLYSPEIAAGVQTNAVRGVFTPLQAVQRLLAGTILAATQKGPSDAIVVARRSPPEPVNSAPSASAAEPPKNNAPSAAPAPPTSMTATAAPQTLRPRLFSLVAGWLALGASWAYPQAAPESGPDATVTLRPFEVVAEREEGYKASNSITASRFALPILDTPMSITVVTEEFMKDIGARNALDSLSYVAGITQNTAIRLEGSTGFNLRGVSVSFNLRDGVTSYGINDSYNIERWEVLKGITAMLYGDRNLGGVVNAISRQPKEKPASEVLFRTDDFGSWRLQGYATGPLIPSGRILYSVSAFTKDEKTYMNDERLQAKGVTGSLAFLPWERTKLTVMYEYYDQNNTLGTKIAPRQTARAPRFANDLVWWQRVDYTPVSKEFSYNGTETYLDEVNRIVGATLDQKLAGWLDFRSNAIYSVRFQDRLNRDAGAVYAEIAPGSARTYLDFSTGTLKTETPADSSYIVDSMNSNLREFDNWNFIWRNDLLATYRFGSVKNRTMVGLEYQERSGHFVTFDSYSPVTLDARNPLAALQRSLDGRGRVNTDLRTFDPRLPMPTRAEMYARRATDPSDQFGSANGSTNETRGTYVIHHSQFWRDRITVFGGLRRNENRAKRSYANLDYVVTRPNGQPRENPLSPRVYNPGYPRPWEGRNSPQAGISVRVRPDVSVYASWADVVVAENGPGVTYIDQLTRDPATNTWTAGPYVQQDPQLGTNKEIGIKTDLFGGRLAATLAGFHTELENKPFTVPTNDPSNITIPAGSPVGTLGQYAYTTLGGLERYRGVELDFVYNVNPQWSLVGSYAFIDAKVVRDSAIRTFDSDPAPGAQNVNVKRNEGQQTPNVPENQFRLWSNYRLPKSDRFWSGVSVGAGVRYYGDAIAGYDNGRNQITHAYTVVDLSVSKSMRLLGREVRGTARVTNLLDEDYISSRQLFGDPRSFVIELRTKL